VSSHPPHDPLGRLLGQRLQTSAAAGAPCPEDDLLAAYADGSLPSEERTAIETHLAACARCAHVLALTMAAGDAAVAGVASPQPPAFGPLWRWLAPAAAAAAGIVFWLVVEAPGPAPVNVPQVARWEQGDQPVAGREATAPEAAAAAGDPDPRSAAGERAQQKTSTGSTDPGASAAKSAGSFAESQPAARPPAADALASSREADADAPAPRAEAVGRAPEIRPTPEPPDGDGVTVTGTPATVDVQNARQRQTFAGEELRELPATRNAGSLLTLVPATVLPSVPGVNGQSTCVGGLAGSGASGVATPGSTSDCTPIVSGANGGGMAAAASLNQGGIAVDALGAPGVPGAEKPSVEAGAASAQDLKFTLPGSLAEPESGKAPVDVAPREEARADGGRPTARPGPLSAAGGQGGGGGRGSAGGRAGGRGGAGTGEVVTAAAGQGRPASRGSTSTAPAVTAPSQDSVVVVQTSDGNVLWRARGRSIERSVNGGLVFAPAYTAPALLAGGMAPAPDTPWFYSSDGTIVRRANGVWRVSSAPGGSRLVSLQATNGASASIALEDGRTFTTSDGGVSWIPQ
jgi:hypothetical protein